MKHKILYVALWLAIIFVASSLYAVKAAEEIGKFKISGSFTFNPYHAQLTAFDDPKIKGVTCYLANVSQSYSLSDPSNASVSCRQTGRISVRRPINKTKKGEDTFSKNKSWGTKVMHVRRIYDARREVLNYVVYTNKTFGGSFKVSVSSVVLTDKIQGLNDD